MTRWAVFGAEHLLSSPPSQDVPHSTPAHRNSLALKLSQEPNSTVKAPCGARLPRVFPSRKDREGPEHQTGSMFVLQTQQTLLFLFCFVSGLIPSTSPAVRDLFLPPARLAPAEMQSPRVPGRKRGRPPLHSTPVRMAVHNLYSASADSLPAVKTPKKRGRKPGHKVWLHRLPSPKRPWAGARGAWAELTAKRDDRSGVG